MRCTLRSLSALLLLASPGLAQVHVFDVDQPASAFTWSGTSSLGNVVGTPTNTFNLSGMLDLDLVGTQPTTAASFVSSDLLVVPDLAGFIPNPIPILPPLATVTVTNLRISVASPQFAVTNPGGAFSATLTLTALSGTLTTTPLGSAPTMSDLTGLVSTPTVAAGTLTRSMDTISLSVPMNGMFPFSVMTTLGTVTGSFDLNGTLFADTTAIDPAFVDACNGDGGDQLGCTNCPCSNNATPGTIGGCLNSAGTATRLGASGDASVSLPSGDTTDLRFTMSGGPAVATSVLLSGDAVAPTSMANPCFGLNSGAQSIDRDGLRCAVQNVLRHGNRQTNALGDIMDSSGPSRVWGGEAQPTAGIAGASGFAAGQTRWFQVTHRDDPTMVCMRGLNTSQAVGVTFEP